MVSCFRVRRSVCKCGTSYSAACLLRPSFIKQTIQNKQTPTKETVTSYRSKLDLCPALLKCHRCNGLSALKRRTAHSLLFYHQYPQEQGRRLRHPRERAGVRQTRHNRPNRRRTMVCASFRGSPRGLGREARILAQVARVPACEGLTLQAGTDFTSGIPCVSVVCRKLSCAQGRSRRGAATGEGAPGCTAVTSEKRSKALHTDSAVTVDGMFACFVEALN